MIVSVPPASTGVDTGSLMGADGGATAAGAFGQLLALLGGNPGSVQPGADAATRLEALLGHLETADKSMLNASMLAALATEVDALKAEIATNAALDTAAPTAPTGTMADERLSEISPDAAVTIAAKVLLTQPTPEDASTLGSGAVAEAAADGPEQLEAPATDTGPTLLVMPERSAASPDDGMPADATVERPTVEAVEADATDHAPPAPLQPGPAPSRQEAAEPVAAAPLPETGPGVQSDQIDLRSTPTATATEAGRTARSSQAPVEAPTAAPLVAPTPPGGERATPASRAPDTQTPPPSPAAAAAMAAPGNEAAADTASVDANAAPGAPAAADARPASAAGGDDAAGQSRQQSQPSAMIAAPADDARQPEATLVEAETDPAATRATDAASPIRSAALPDATVLASTVTEATAAPTSTMPAAPTNPAITPIGVDPAPPAQSTDPMMRPAALSATTVNHLQEMREGADVRRRIVVRLDPPGLGSVTLDMTALGDDVRLVARAETVEAVRALLRQQADVQQALAAHGMSLLDFDVHDGAPESRERTSPDGDGGNTRPDSADRALDEQTQAQPNDQGELFL